MEIIEIIEINYSDTPDSELLADILTQQMIDIGQTKSRSEIEIAIQNALKPTSRAKFFLAKEDNNLVGVVFINICSGIESGGDYVWINEIQISPNYRNKGYGKKLLNHVLEWSKLNSIKTVFGVTESSNVASQALFSSENFTIGDIKWVRKDL